MEAISGLTTIRAFRAQQESERRFVQVRQLVCTVPVVGSRGVGRFPKATGGAAIEGTTAHAQVLRIYGVNRRANGVFWACSCKDGALISTLPTVHPHTGARL